MSHRSISQLRQTFAAASFLVLLLSAACTRKSPPSGPPPPLVSVATPILREIVEWDEFIGRLASPERVEIRARVSGYLDEFHFQAGREVKKGDLLFTIDPRPYRAEYERADAEHQRALDQAELAKSEADRAKRLGSTRVIAIEELDQKTRAHSSALAAARATKAAADLAKLNLEFTEIRAPISGRISRALVTPGNLVSGGIAGTGSTLLTTIESVEPIYLYADADERSILKYIRLSRDGIRESARDHQIPAEMALGDEAGFPHKGYIGFVENRVDSTTGTLRARGVFPNEDRKLFPGLFARMRIPGSGKYQALLIPDRALGADQAQKFVYVVDAEQKVQFRPVTTGRLHDGLRIVVAGLQGDEQVIVEGQMRIRPGVVVQVKPAEAR